MRTCVRLTHNPHTQHAVCRCNASFSPSSLQAARQLLDGEALEDIVRLHAAVFGTLADMLGAAHPAVGAQQHLGPAAAQHSFAMSYELGAELLESLGLRARDGGGNGGVADEQQGSPALLLQGAAVDDATLNGHLFRWGRATTAPNTPNYQRPLCVT